MFAIIVTGRDGSETELCRCRTNPEVLAEAARKKKTRVGRRFMTQYPGVRIERVHEQEEVPGTEPQT
jgi:hypothetical protein